MVLDSIRARYARIEGWLKTAPVRSTKLRHDCDAEWFDLVRDSLHGELIHLTTSTSEGHFYGETNYYFHAGNLFFVYDVEYYDGVNLEENGRIVTRGGAAFETRYYLDEGALILQLRKEVRDEEGKTIDEVPNEVVDHGKTSDFPGKSILEILKTGVPDC